VWQHLESWFNTASLARALDLKHMLGIDQTMDSYLRSIKTIADALAVFQTPISDLELI